MTKGQLAKEIFMSGKNCSSAVMLAFKEELKLKQSDIEKLSIGFGGGFGRQRLVCGAVCGMTMVLSYLLSDGENKLAIYKIIQDACKDFKSQLKTLICSELLEGITNDTTPEPEQRTNSYYKKRPCAEIVEIAADIAQKYIT